MSALSSPVLTWPVSMQKEEVRLGVCFLWEGVCVSSRRGLGAKGEGKLLVRDCGDVLGKNCDPFGCFYGCVGVMDKAVMLDL